MFLLSWENDNSWDYILFSFVINNIKIITVYNHNRMFIKSIFFYFLRKKENTKVL